MANEVKTYQTQSSTAWGTPGSIPGNRRAVGYDGNGNFRASKSGGTAANYTDAVLSEQVTVDAWNRVTKSENTLFSGHSYQTQYSYNGLGWVVKEHQADIGTVADKRRWIYYSPSWQPIEELEDWTPETSGAPSVERKTQQFWGLRGVNDAVLRRCDTDVDGDWDTTDEYAGGGSFYQLSDSLFSVIAHVRSSDGQVACRFSYDSYGKYRVHLSTDFNGDGLVNATDVDDSGDGVHGFLAAYAAGLPSADYNGDGVVDEVDYDAFVKYNSAEQDYTRPVQISQPQFLPVFLGSAQRSARSACEPR